MSQQIDDGGPAYPCEAYQCPQDTETTKYRGMSLRDWFAGQALAGLLADPNGSGDMDAITRGTYMLADKMLSARLTKPE